MERYEAACITLDFQIASRFEVNASMSAMRRITYRTTLTWDEMGARLNAFPRNRFTINAGIQSGYARADRLSILGLEVTMHLTKTEDRAIVQARVTPPFATYAVTGILCFLASTALISPTALINHVPASWVGRLGVCATCLIFMTIARFLLRRERQRFLRQTECLLGLEPMTGAESKT